LNLPRTALYYYAQEDEEIPSLNHPKDGSRGFAFISEVNRQVRNLYGPGPFTENVFNELRDQELLSLDLSRCSDLIVPSLSKALTDGFITGVGIDSDVQISMMLDIIEIPTDIEYPAIKQVVHGKTGGPLMGDAPTWFVDNAYTRFASWLARSLSSNGITPEFLGSTRALEIACNICLPDLRRRILTAGHPDWRRKRCGDDEIAMDTPQNNSMVCAIYPCLGGKISEGTNIASTRFGIYTEEAIRKCDIISSSQLLDFSDIIRIKNITIPDTARHPGQKMVPSSWTRGRAAQSTLLWFPQDSIEFYIGGRVAELLNRDFISKIRKMGLYPYLPASLGGFYYPDIHNVMWEQLTTEYKAVITYWGNPGHDLPPPSFYYEVDSVSNLFSLEQAASPNAKEDDELRENVLRALDSDYLSRATVRLSATTNDNPMRFFKKVELGIPVRIYLNGSWGGAYVSLPYALKEIRTRIRLRSGHRGLVPGITTLPSLQKQGRRLKRWVKSAHERFNLSSSFVEPTDGREFIQKLQSDLEGRMQLTYVNMDTVDQFLPQRLKSIPVSSDGPA
jgi:hypothetical protein